MIAVGCGQSDEESRSENPQAIHVHGLAINPGDQALFIATHAGVFRSAADSTNAEPVGPRQDTMGFTIVGPDRFLASGHPVPGEGASPHLGLIESRDAGQSWTPISLQGEADFHVLRFAHDRVYAYDGLGQRLMLSEDGGESWTERRKPSPIFDLAVSPTDAERVIVATERGLFATEITGKSWQRLSGPSGLLAWPARNALYMVDGSGTVRRSGDGGHTWERRGDVGGSPAAFSSAPDDRLFAALKDGTVVASADEAASWTLRSAL